MPPNKLLLVFGLRGTMLERMHKSKVLATMPQPSSSLGMHRIWLRPHLIPTLQELQSNGCDFAVWSSATKRNTDPLVKHVLPSEETGIDFKFVWSRENTTPDEFRRSVVVESSDEWATLKELSTLEKSSDFGGGEKQEGGDYFKIDPARTVFVDNTPSKLRTSAGNFLWLDSCEEDAITEETALLKMKDFVLDELIHAKDVRTILPRRISPTSAVDAILSSSK